MFFSAGRDLLVKALIRNKDPRRTIHLEGETVELIQIVLRAGMRTLDLTDVAAGDVEEIGEVVLRVAIGLPVGFHEPDDREVECRFSCLLHRPCKKMKPMCYLAYKIISKIQGRLVNDMLRHSLQMIEDLIYQMAASVDRNTAEAAIAGLPAEYGLVLDLHYGWELSRREIAALLGWSQSKVNQRITRGVSLLKYKLHPEAFDKAESVIGRAPVRY